MAMPVWDSMSSSNGWGSESDIALGMKARTDMATGGRRGSESSLTDAGTTGAACALVLVLFQHSSGEPVGDSFVD
jgi:hypothetical protein